MASIMALTREDHLDVLFKMVSFLKSKRNRVVVFDPTEVEIYQTQFPTEDWSATPHGVCKEDTPMNSPTPRGIGFTMRAFFDSDIAGDYIARRSRTVFIVFLKNTPIFVH